MTQWLPSQVEFGQLCYLVTVQLEIHIKRLGNERHCYCGNKQTLSNQAWQHPDNRQYTSHGRCGELITIPAERLTLQEPITWTVPLSLDINSTCLFTFPFGWWNKINLVTYSTVYRLSVVVKKAKEDKRRQTFYYNFLVKLFNSIVLKVTWVDWSFQLIIKDVLFPLEFK